MTVQVNIDGMPVNSAPAFELDKDLTNFSIKWSALFTGMWLVLFFSSKFILPLPERWGLKKPFDKMIVRHRIISALHGVSAIALSAWHTYNYLDLSCGKQATNEQIFVMTNTGAFLIADLIFMMANGFLDIGNLLHHLIGIVVYASCIVVQRDCNFMTFHLFPGEITNI